MLKDILKQKDYLPILKMSDGTAVTKENWEKRKKELFSALYEYSYGFTPDIPVKVWGETTFSDNISYAGKVLNDKKWVMNGQDNQTDLICLPQPLAESAKAIISYSINPPGDDTPAVNVTVEARLDDIVGKEWEPGRRYTYNIVIDLDEIYFAPEVEAWDDVVVTPDVVF